MAFARRELTWLACDALAALGRKPSIASVREWTTINHGRKQGSDTDTQADINAWYGVLLAMKKEQHAIAGMPESVAALAHQLWIKATQAAIESLAAQRSALDAELVEIRLAIATASLATATAMEQVATVSHERDVAQEAVRRLEEALVHSHANAQAAEMRYATQIQARDERISAILEDAAKKDAERATRIAELDGLRKHALMQIDEARRESRDGKVAHDQAMVSHKQALATERAALTAANAGLASATGRLSAIEESLSASELRNKTLEETVARLQQQSLQNSTIAQSKKFGVARLAKTSSTLRKRKL